MDNQFERELQACELEEGLYHYGMPRRSGRYPWGSGEEPFQHNGPHLLGRADQLIKKHPDWTKSQIAEAIGLTTTDYNTLYSLRKDITYAENRAKAFELRDKKQLSNTKIAEMLGVTEGTVRNYFKDKEDRRLKEINETMDILRDSLKKHKYIDVSKGNEVELNITYDRLKDSVNRLEALGECTKQNVQLEQMGTGKKTTISVIGPLNSTWQDAQKNRFNLGLINGYKDNETKTLRNIEPPVDIKSKRINIRYAEDGGIDKDGVIEIRRGVDDLSLGRAQYAQVRIAVDGTHFLKGMAVYGDAKDFPPGVDIIFNTNKTKDTPKMDVLKKMKVDKVTGEIDEQNPFGTTIKPTEKLVYAQRYYTDKNGKEHQSAINIVREQGDWDTWSKTLAHQFLAKQPIKLINERLNYTYKDKKAEFEELKSLNNPTVKKHLLEKFAESCESDSAYMKAAALPRQGSHVILPLPKLAANEIYAPNYKNGEQVVLVRYPHGGTFEIPQLKVNNNSPYAKSTLKNAPDAVGINPVVAQKLSGADFDGDTVMVIPVNSRVKIKTDPTLPGLKDFEPKEVYKGYEGMVKMQEGQQTQKQMGRITNLLTDMTIKGAPLNEIERVVKHSMVVIDAAKHGLDYKTSEKQNGISELKRIYQGGANKGAATIFSRAKAERRVPERADNFKVDPETGDKIYRETGRMKSRLNKETGEWEKYPAMTKSKRMYEVKDAMELVGDPPTTKEIRYAKYANQMKEMARQARLAALDVKPQRYSKSAAQAYSKEIESLENKLKEVVKQKPLERKAQAIAGEAVKQATYDNPSLWDDKDQLSKIKAQFLEGARSRVGKTKTTIDINDREWAAIQSGALTQTKAKEILLSADLDKIRERATPKQTRGISSAMEMRIKNMLSSGLMTQTEIADQLGISVSTVKKVMSGKK